MALRILIAEHETALGMFVTRSLEKEDHTVTLVGDGAAAATAIASADYDLFLLDLDLPGDIGMRVLEVARQLGNGMRVLVLSAHAAELETRIACLEGGADDCLMKPFAMRELKARCRAMVRRQDGGAVLRCGGLELNRLQQSLERGDESITLSRREFGLLEREVEPGPVSKRGDSTVEMVDARHDATILGHPTAKCGVVIGDSVR